MRPQAQEAHVRYRDDILALLEERPYASQELADVLEVQSGIHQACQAMARRGLIVRLGSTGPWALPGAVPPTETGCHKPRTKLCDACGAEFTPRANAQQRCMSCRIGRLSTFEPVPRSRKDLAAARLADLIRVEEPTVGTHVCARCTKRFTPRLGASGRFCSDRCAETPAPPEITRRVIDGQEYEVLSVGRHALTDWPDSGGGSSLGGSEFGIPRTRHRSAASTATGR